MRRHNILLLTQYSLLLTFIAVLSSCANQFIEPYGYVTPDKENIRHGINKASIPSNAPSISQGYKPEVKASLEKNGRVHNGIDVIEKSGTPVIATAEGIVLDSYFEPFYGNRVTLGHGKDAKGLFLKSNYFHLQKRIVKTGDKVKRGQQIGTLGRTGLLSGGFPHLHFEIRSAETIKQLLTTPLHPHKFWHGGPGVITCFDKNRTYQSSSFKTTYPVPCLGIDWKQEELQGQID